MSIRTTAVTIAAICDGASCRLEVTASGRTLADANANLRGKGWTINAHRTFCRQCSNDRTRLITAGVLDRTGSYILNMPAYDAFLDQRAKAVRP